MAYRRERSIREIYEDRINGRSQQVPYQRTVSLVDRRPVHSWTEEDYDQEGDYNYGHGRGGYHGDDRRGYYGEREQYSGEKRGGPHFRREDPYFYSRGSAEELPMARQVEIRNNSRVSSQPRGQKLPPPRPLMSVPRRGDDSVMNVTVNLDRRDERESLKRKASFPHAREQSPPKREVPLANRSRSSRSYSPECSKTSSSPPLPKMTTVQQEKEGPPNHHTGESQDGSPHSSVLATKQEEKPGTEMEQCEETEVKEDAEQSLEARRAHVIANKALEIEKLYRQDCETFGMVVKMLIAKQPTLEKQLQTALKENLAEIKERCLEDLRHFISEVNVVLKSDQA
ncbi:periphilin-1 isoform X1 [Pygocentrus nattereri]|uniref:Periphilin-1 C-terminal domain-containing protein n=1 Tax=Pygocentrus nattereri TaxID=42514 RepID=A0A3B4E6X8_PYGNA|nr:periphilin-1 isoform X1 [Pygocentrus nattereri]